MSRLRLVILPLFLLSLLAGCDQLGIESATQVAEKREAEGKAVGGACRHAGRAIEDCYTLNKRVDKAAIYAGWREMDDYMRENKISPVAPVLTPGAPPRVASGKVADEAGSDAPAKDEAADGSTPKATADAKPAKSSDAKRS